MGSVFDDQVNSKFINTYFMHFDQLRPSRCCESKIVDLDKSMGWDVQNSKKGFDMN